ncbi:hypothetical protein LXA43DRAFT_1103412 [Ganoderma leucocontextum]|nr:hypothetical protein LXA43DRAFT_1103412 [Ganoderma leucocontextum]
MPFLTSSICENTHVVPLDDPYLLVIPKALHLLPSCHICTLRLPDPNPGERVVWHEVYTGDRPQTSEGHFRTDRSPSTVVLTFYILGAEREH